MTTRRRDVRAAELGRVGVAIPVSIASSMNFPARKNSLFHRCFCNQRELAGRRRHRIAFVCTIDARERAMRAFHRVVAASHTHFVKWNAAFFVVL
jgi:hypothetical protein